MGVVVLDYRNHLFYLALAYVEQTESRSIVFKTEDKIAAFLMFDETVNLLTQGFLDIE